MLEKKSMKRFKKILVGVDLSWGDGFVADALSEPNAEAVRQTLWLAQLNSASVDFLFSLDLSAKAQQLIAESSMNESTVLDEAEIGPPDSAIMHCIERHSVDLVVMDTVGRTGISGFITGKTAERLLPQIPCSLLAVKPPGFESPVSPGQRRA